MLSHGEHFGVVERVAVDASGGKPQQLSSVLLDIFALKASATLHGRAGPILRYLKFCKKEGQPPFPFREDLLYRFVKEYCARQAPTFARSFLSSVAFCRHVLEFRPDCTRSGMFTPERPTAPEALPDDVSESTEGSEDEEHPDLEEEEQAVNELVGPWQPEPGLRERLDEAEVFRHRVSRFIHVVSSEEGTMFRCGRAITSSYSKCDDIPQVLYPFCKQCYPRSSEGPV